MEQPSRIIAVDWSGDAKEHNQRKKIQLVKVTAGMPTAPEGGRTRQEVCDYLIDEAKKDHKLVVGLDFAFSFPYWFLEEKGIHEPVELWERSIGEGEDWMSAYPFWSGKGDKRSSNPLRKTEKQVTNLGRGQPESVFKLVGRKQVGKGSVRGMPYLFRLHEAGFTVWPFDRPELPMVIEIYPQSLMKKQVTKSDQGSREAYIEKHYGYLPDEWKQQAAHNDDAFDAAMSALVLFQPDIVMFRATQQRQDKAQSAENGAPLSRTATPYWRCCVAPCGRAGKRSPAALRRLARTRHSRRSAPCAQPLACPLIWPAEHVNIRLKEY